MMEQVLPDDINQLSNMVKDCKKCALAKTRTNVVFGVGSTDAELMFVGEAPGFYEDKQGEPFVGAAGQLLDQLLKSIGLTRSEVYIANVLKCRPPQNRDPKPEEIEFCKPYLLKQIELIKPKVICTLGNFATKVILEKSVSISRVHGQRFEKGRFYVLPTYHPAAALYMRTTQEALEKDFEALKELLAEEPIEVGPEPEQMGLF